MEKWNVKDIDAAHALVSGINKMAETTGNEASILKNVAKDAEGFDKTVLLNQSVSRYTEQLAQCKVETQAALEQIAKNCTAITNSAEEFARIAAQGGAFN